MQLRGLAGTDVTINAPLGVTVLTDEGEIVGDLTTNNQTITVAQGRLLVLLQMILFTGHFKLVFCNQYLRYLPVSGYMDTIGTGTFIQDIGWLDMVLCAGSLAIYRYRYRYR
jgi:hypothetical protein